MGISTRVVQRNKNVIRWENLVRTVLLKTVKGMDLIGIFTLE